MQLVGELQNLEQAYLHYHEAYMNTGNGYDSKLLLDFVVLHGCLNEAYRYLFHGVHLHVKPIHYWLLHFAPADYGLVFHAKETDEEILHDLQHV